MKQSYEFPHEGDLISPAPTQPSEQTLHTIMNFARCYQSVEVAGVHIDFYLN